MGIFSVLFENHKYRKEDKRRASMGLPSQRESENAKLRAMMHMTGMAPKEGLEDLFGWDPKRDGIRGYEVRIAQFRERLTNLQTSGAPIVEQLELEQKIRQLEKSLAELRAHG
jgi:hypothetical protein